MTQQTILVNSSERRTEALHAVSMINIDRPLEVVIRPKKRSLDQNALYWKWVNIIATDTGGDNESVHEGLKSLFLEAKPKAFGRGVYFTTTKLSVKEMKAYMDQIYAYVHTVLDIHLPVPEEQYLKDAG